jgi:hypothetical protein
MRGNKNLTSHFRSSLDFMKHTLIVTGIDAV